MIKNYPLHWPIGYPRTNHPQVNRQFKATFAYSRDNCINQIRLLGGKDVIISTDIPVRQDGLPYANAASRSMNSQGVAVYFNYNGEQVVFACDKWHRVEANMQSIAKSIEAIRGLDRWGVSEMLKRVFTGFEALPQPETEWYSILEVSEHAQPEEVKQKWREKILQHHPDRFGNINEYHRINNAYEKYKSLKNL